MECAPASALLCSTCDENVHRATLLHDREAWNGSHFIPIVPTVSINEQTMEMKTIG